MILNSYDAESVVVKESLIPYAGEGLFAKRNFASGELISLFNGIRINKDGCRGKIIRGDDDDDEEWSDYRLTLGKNELMMLLRGVVGFLLPRQVCGSGHPSRVDLFVCVLRHHGPQGLPFLRPQERRLPRHIPPQVHAYRL